MASTEDLDLDEKLREFLRTVITPVAEQLRARGVIFFARVPSGNDETWWQAPEGSIEPCDLSRVDIGDRLRELWVREGLPELAALSSRLIDIARTVAAAEPEASAEVSPFIYVMF